MKSNNSKNETELQHLLESIGKKITELRKKKGFTSHEDFANDFDLARIQYWRIEKGKANLTLKSLYRLLKIHDITIEEFFSTLYKKSKK